MGTYSYAYDANKNRTAEAITGPMSDYGYAAAYDAEDRLVEWERSDGQQDQSWLLTPAGDWDRFTEETTAQSRTHNDAHAQRRARTDGGRRAGASARRQGQPDGRPPTTWGGRSSGTGTTR